MIPKTPLHLEALHPRQRTVLCACGSTSARWGAYLAGGTALALQVGHRVSVDLDWFTPRTLAPAVLLAGVRALGFPVTVDQNDVGTFLGQVGGVKFSVFRYRYRRVAPGSKAEGCRLASLRDLGAMKLAAIMSRATKRDYVDIHALVTKRGMPLADLVAAFRSKYPGVDPGPALRALTYFADVDEEPMPAMLDDTTWKDVKAGLRIAMKAARAGR